MIFTVIWGVLIFVRFLGFSGLPEEVSRWWLPGQHTAGGEKPTWPGRRNRLHHALRSGDEIFIEPYQIRAVISGAEQPAADPFGDLFAAIEITVTDCACRNAFVIVQCFTRNPQILCRSSGGDDNALRCNFVLIVDDKEENLYYLRVHEAASVWTWIVRGNGRQSRDSASCARHPNG